jgi:hypothetical protein
VERFSGQPLLNLFRNRKLPGAEKVASSKKRTLGKTDLNKAMSKLWAEVL